MISKRIWREYGFCISPSSGTFWIRTNRNVYFARAPWHEPLFSERYVDKPKSYCGWRFTRRALLSDLNKEGGER